MKAMKAKAKVKNKVAAIRSMLTATDDFNHSLDEVDSGLKKGLSPLDAVDEATNFDEKRMLFRYCMLLLEYNLLLDTNPPTKQLHQLKKKLAMTKTHYF